MHKVRKARLLGYNLTEEQLRLLYYVWAKCDSTSYCNILDGGTCYAHPNFQLIRFNLEAEEFLESDANDATFIRLSDKGRNLIMKLGM
jgi:hypothetical protein